VVVPTARTVPRPLAEFELSCPQGAVAAGLDAELSVQSLDVNWLAMLGAPVNPGVSTNRSVLFYGRYVGASAAAPTFRPHLVGAVSVSERISGNRVALTARAGAAIAGVRTVVQVGALCAGATA
jgi:hypothetical protein